MRLVAIYAGRFQPFGPHHKKAFDWLCSKFGHDNCYISTSDKVDNLSPLSFDEKVNIIKKYGIDNVIKSSSPYRLIDPRFDPDKTVLFVMLGEKDEGRIQYFKKDGSPGYFQEYYGQRDLEPMRKTGYVLIAPHVSVKYNNVEISGTVLRRILPTVSDAEFKSIMGWHDRGIHNLMKVKFNEELNDFNDTMIDLPKEESIPIDVSFDFKSSLRRHISHLYEDESLSRDDIVTILQGLSDGSIPAYEKFDGVNLKVTIKNNRLVAARNKQDIINPLTRNQLKDRYSDRYNLQTSFVQAFDDLMTWIIKMPRDIKEHIESSGIWINLEIVNPILDSGYKYGYEPLIVIHGFVDSAFNKIYDFDLDRFLPSTLSNYTVTGPNKIKIPSMPLYISQISSLIKTTNNLEMILNQIGWKLLSNCSGYKAQESDIVNRLTEVGKQVARCNDSKIRQKYFANLEQIDFSKILPFEGIVFEWKDKLYKLTGYFKYQNQILHIFRK